MKWQTVVIEELHRRRLSISPVNRLDRSYGTVHLPLLAHAAGPMARHGPVDWSIATQLNEDKFYPRGGSTGHAKIGIALPRRPAFPADRRVVAAIIVRVVAKSIAG